MQLGSRGDDVRRWQRFLNEKVSWSLSPAPTPLVEDGIFGPATLERTGRWQAMVGLPKTSVVDGPTWRHLAKLRFMHAWCDAVVPARNFTPVFTPPRACDLVVIHTMEAPEKPGRARQVASWFAGEGGIQAPRASAHYCVDDVDVVQCVREEDIGWHAPGANHNGIGIEHAGYARQTTAEWSDAYSTAMLLRSARLTASICARRAIPIRFVSAQGLLARERGITGHVHCTNAFSKGQGHTDPGPAFPWAWYIEQVRLASPAPPTTT